MANAREKNSQINSAEGPQKKIGRAVILSRVLFIVSSENFLNRCTNRSPGRKKRAEVRSLRKNHERADLINLPHSF